jgi:signal transduction histidine kinase
MDREPGPNAGEEGGRLLIVDDVADNRAILRRRFERRGFLISEADSGAGALEAIEREAFDVVLLDVMMPDMDGLEVLRRIRQGHSASELPVIMVTGRTESQDIVQALSEGANDYITKPVDFAVANLRVSTQVARKRAEEQVRLANAALSRANDDLEQKIAERTAELVASNARLRAAMDEAQAANQAKDEFLVIVSHELRTPLNGLIPMAELLARSGLTEQQKKVAAIITASAGQMNAVVADLLDVLDLRAGKAAAASVRTPLGSLLREAASGAAAAAAAKGLEFRLAIAPEAEGEAAVDAGRLRTVVAKLLDNAVKFTRSGAVSLEAGLGAAGESLRIRVRDTGLGFDGRTAERLFLPFEQADSSLSRQFGGLGLGLSICHGFVELMGGSIAAEGAPGEGACFTVEIPLDGAARRAA